ncbi:MAG: GGDEF domain-containing protein [Gammaproteobacteria bacterium]|nr:GGDEF domain-containing protein [Gammaproteobacteria bacterium]
MLKYIHRRLAKQTTISCFFTMFVATCAIGILDYLIGPELSFSVFYTIPIMLAAWYGGKIIGFSIAIISAGVWLAADLAAGNQYSSLLIPAWNTSVRLAFFLIILWLLLIIRKKLALEESLADTDHLTGLANRRYFYEQLEHECTLIRRYPKPFTIAYIDLDNFKYVNDTFGHDTGDELLLAVSENLKNNLRDTDISARLGGDEFAVLFPFLNGEDAVPLLNQLQRKLLDLMNVNKWPVTFSIGSVTFSKVMGSSRDMIKLVDDLMYDVKKSGKNNIQHKNWPGL